MRPCIPPVGDPPVRVPPVSVVIPMHNAQRTIAAAIESVLAQTAPALEILVVDNGSTDRSVSVAARYSPPVRVLHESRRGVAAARNHGAAHAVGEYLAFLDADDLMPADRLAFQVRIAEQNPTAEIVFGRQCSFRDGETPPSAAGTSADRLQSAPLAGAMLCRRSAFERVGPFRESLQAGEFLDWFARAQDVGIAFSMPDHLVLYRRVHAGNLTRNRQLTHAEYARAIKHLLDRRRGSTTNAR